MKKTLLIATVLLASVGASAQTLTCNIETMSNRFQKVQIEGDDQEKLVKILNGLDDYRKPEDKVIKTFPRMKFKQKINNVSYYGGPKNQLRLIERNTGIAFNLITGNAVQSTFLEGNCK